MRHVIQFPWLIIILIAALLPATAAMSANSAQNQAQPASSANQPASQTNSQVIPEKKSNISPQQSNNQNPPIVKQPDKPIGKTVIKTPDANITRGPKSGYQTAGKMKPANNIIRTQDSDHRVSRKMQPAAGQLTTGQKRNGYVSDEEAADNSPAQPLTADQNPVGRWKSVDFVKEITDFKPGIKSWKADLYLKGLVFYQGGKTSGPWTWNNDILWHPGDRTEAKYLIQTINGSKYMFMEWMSGDVTIRGQKPWYYVLMKND